MPYAIRDMEIWLESDVSGSSGEKSQTIARNMLQMRHWPRDLKRIMASVKTFDPQLIISDLILRALVATLYDLPLISIDNQHILVSAKLTIQKSTANICWLGV